MMPEFEPVAVVRNGSISYSDRYIADLPNGTLLYTADQLNQTYAAGQADGKAMPMKYRRMEFNAQLQEELKVAQAELVAAREELAELAAGKDLVNKWFQETFEQLAQAQAENEKLRGVITNAIVMVGHPDNIDYLENALATPPDDSALREYSAKLVERVFAYWFSAEEGTGSASEIIDQIRKGEWK